MNNRLKILSAAAIAIFTSCGGNKGAESMEKGESSMAVVEAAMMEGRNAARVFLSQDPTDTMAMEQKLLNARAIQSRYVNDNNHDAAMAFDTAFIHTLRAARPELAQQIETAYSPDNN